MNIKKTNNIKGYIAILMWSFSALFVAWTPSIPPLLLASLTSGVGFIFFCIKWSANKKLFYKALKQPLMIWILFFLAVPAYRTLYFSGLKMAPIIESNLVNYLWPILILILSRTLDRQKQSAYFYIGSFFCILGLICIGLTKTSSGLFLYFEWGHFFAFLGAFIWALYCVLTRRYPTAPTDMIGIMHALSFLILFSLYYIFEPAISIAQLDIWHWFGIIGLGLSVSVGYTLWDDAMSHGEREKVAVMAYFTPLLSTGWLLIITGTSMNFLLWAATALILGGTYIARAPAKSS